MTCTQRVLGLIVLIGAASVAFAQEPTKGLLPIPDYTQDLHQASHLAGDFNGGRTALAEKGVQIDVNWTQVAQKIVDGGRDTDKAYGGNVDMLIRLDLMKMGVMQGAMITLRTESRYGESVNGAAGPILPVNADGFFPLTDELDDDICIAITNLYYTQFLSEHIAIIIGKLDTLDGDLNEFASGRGTSQFMNANFLFNGVTALRLPYSTLGGAVLWIPNQTMQVKASLINTIDSSTTTGFDDFGDDLTASVEANFQYRLGDLPGGCNVGGLYSFDQDFSEIGGQLILPPQNGLAISSKDSTWAVYASMLQYRWVEDPSEKPINISDGRPDRQGVGVFARIGGADQDTNPVHWSGSVGIGGRGLIPSRDNDTFGVGYYYTNFQETRFTNIAGIDDNGQGFEAFYNIALTPAANLTFDVQLQDDAFPGTDTAVILGARLNLSF